jgi:hypothetical protein
VACEVVFDALSCSQAGITEREKCAALRTLARDTAPDGPSSRPSRCDERRAAYETQSGGFDAEAFEADLQRGRLNIAKAYLLFPVGPNLIATLVFFGKANGLQVIQDYLAQTQAVLSQ